MKWYVRILMALLVVVLSPIIVIFLICAAITYVFQLPKNKKEYKKSQYYKEFGLPFTISRLYSPEYRFFNSLKKRDLPVNYIRQASNGLQYFIYNDSLFLFPDFDQIDFNEETSEWQVNYDGDWQDFEQAYKDIVSKVDPDALVLPVKLLVERKMFPKTDLKEVSIPEPVFLVFKYETAFENQDSTLKLSLPTNTQELYDMMLATPDLCGDFLIAENGNIHWNLYKDIQIEIGVHTEDCYFSIDKKLFGEIKSEIIHWHPTNFEIYNDVCNIGMPGSVLVIQTIMSGASVLYMGDERNCPYSPNKKVLFGKYYYLKAN